VTSTVEIFRLLRFGGGSWVLLEHPKKTDDVSLWNGKRRAMAQLNDEELLAALKAGEDGQKRLSQIGELAQREIETTQTWVNLNHAIAITEVPTEEAKLEFSIKSVDVKSKR
jgi:hypothetical protein